MVKQKAEIVIDSLENLNRRVLVGRIHFDIHATSCSTREAYPKSFANRHRYGRAKLASSCSSSPMLREALDTQAALLACHGSDTTQ
jgi:hypothetical protein